MMNENQVPSLANTIALYMPCESFMQPWEQVGRTPRQTEIGLNWLNFNILHMVEIGLKVKIKLQKDKIALIPQLIM